MQGLAYAYETNSNYRFIDQAPNLRGAGEAHIQIADICRHMALLTDEGPERDGYFSEAHEELDLAEGIYRGLTGKRATRGLANTLKTRGSIMRTQQDYLGAQRLWEQAHGLFVKNEDHVSEADMAKALSELAVEVDRTSVFMRKMKEMRGTDNREEQAIRAAFDKFDYDGSGTMDMKEYQALASELGTFPPLREDELAEALLQLDNSVDSKVQWEEFITWWMTDQILRQDESRAKAGARRGGAAARKGKSAEVASKVATAKVGGGAGSGAPAAAAATAEA